MTQYNPRILTIDRGNSSMKAVVWEKGSPLCSLRFFDVTVESLLPLLDEFSPEGCAFCSVGHVDAKFLETLRRLTDGKQLVLTPSTPLPMDIKYASRATLGADRIAAACGASSLFPGKPMLVVDAGTAMTLDLVDPSGNFNGGNITPGVSMRFSALHCLTDRLPLVSPEGDLPLFGHDTDTAIRSGVLRGMAAEISAAYANAARHYGVVGAVATGNDAAVLLPLLEECGMEVSIDENLVGRGLLEIYKHNINIRI